MSTLNTITVLNQTGLDTTKHTVWVAGFMQQTDSNKKTVYWSLNPDGSFSAGTGSSAFININSGLTISVPDVTNLGNNRLVFTVTNGSTPADLSPITGYTAYPFPGAPGVCPPGPYDIFEFGPNAQYDVSAVDSFGLNLSFTVTSDTLTYGAVTTFTRKQIGDAFTAFVKSDSPGCGFEQLLFTSLTGKGYPDLIDGQFSAIVAPKDWLAIYPTATGLSGYWDDTIDAFFANGNELSIDLNAATVGTYAGSCDGTRYKLTGPIPAGEKAALEIIIPASDFKVANAGFIQAVRGQDPKESDVAYAAFNQIEAAIFEAISRGVALDGVWPNQKEKISEKKTGKKHPIPANYSSDAWVDYSNWFTKHTNAYNDKPSVYDVYAKFFHYGKITAGSNAAANIFGVNTGGTFGMAYGFSLDESPNVGTWSTKNNVPAKTAYNVGLNQNVTLVVGKWK